MWRNCKCYWKTRPGRIALTRVSVIREKPNFLNMKMTISSVFVYWSFGFNVSGFWILKSKLQIWKFGFFPNWNVQYNNQVQVQFLKLFRRAIKIFFTHACRKLIFKIVINLFSAMFSICWPTRLSYRTLQLICKTQNFYF